MKNFIAVCAILFSCVLVGSVEAGNCHSNVQRVQRVQKFVEVHEYRQPQRIVRIREVPKLQVVEYQDVYDNRVLVREQVNDYYVQQQQAKVQQQMQKLGLLQRLRNNIGNRVFELDVNRRVRIVR